MPEHAAMATTVALYFIASPLQYLAARRIAERFESEARQVLVWYKKGVTPIVRTEDWDTASYMSWPRWEPLPGLFGRHRRLRANIPLVAGLVGACDTLHIHSAVFDTEAINYFLRALPRICGATVMRARILPDGIISVRRYPLGPLKAAAQYLRKLRRLIAPELDYWCFSGDRIGSDASFCDRIYVLPGLPHEYPDAKVMTLSPLVEQSNAPIASGRSERRALVIGQPLCGTGLMSAADVAMVTAEIHAWLAEREFSHIDYKGHPKDPKRELMYPDYHLVDPSEVLEMFMAGQHYDAVVGVRSSALLFARQIYSSRTQVEAFGWSRIRFKSPIERESMTQAFDATGVHIRP
jgi:hypothetical protein